MKIKTIRKILNDKFNQFLESIKDEAVKKLVQKNSLISGGSIASMLLKEKINDFDIYFLNKETCLAVANYYKQEMLRKDPDLVIKLIDMDEVLKLADEDPEKRYIMERGFKEPGRVGIFCKNQKIEPKESTEEEVIEVLDTLHKEEEGKDEGEKFRVLYVSPNAISLSHKVQIILRFYGSPEEIHSNYDFIHCTNYWLSEDGKLYLNQKALESILTKQLCYVGSKYPIASVIRTRKFVQRQWAVNAGDYLKMCFQISKLDLENISVLEDQLVGVDVMYFVAVIDALKKAQIAHANDKEPFVFTYTYICEILDRIFND